MDIDEIVQACAANTEFVSEWDRLTGGRLQALAIRSPIEAMVDDATGHETMLGMSIAKEFVSFVVDTVISRM
jgi:hypothetical protein